MKKGLFVRKSLRAAEAGPDATGEHPHRHLGAFQLAMIGVGAIIGAGIFVVTGQAAAVYAGPGIVISFILAAIICLFAGLCYAELSSLIPIGGGIYTYSYVAMGEFAAWIVGWALCTQYIISISTVAVGWGGYFVSLLSDFGVTLSTVWTNAPIHYAAGEGWSFTGAVCNLPAALLIALIGVLISGGIRAAALFNNVMVAIKIGTILLFIVLGFFYVQADNWSPLVPENLGHFGQLGWSGIFRAAGLLFFAYLGFDTVATLAQEAKNPQNDLPKGILGSLGISTIAYIATALVLTGVVSYTLLNVPDPMSVALDAMGSSFAWVKFLVKFAIVAGLASVVLVQTLGQSRVFLAIGKDGLLPKPFAKTKGGSPVFSILMTTAIATAGAAFFPVGVLAELVAVAALFLFAFVCTSVLILRKTHPEYKRPFEVPMVPVLPLAGIFCCVAQMVLLPMVIWVQFFVWILVGIGVYFGYSMKNSKIRAQ